MSARSKHEELIVSLVTGIGQRQLYYSKHPKVQASAEKLTRLLEGWFGEEKRKAFFLGIAQGNLVYEGRFLVGPTIMGRKIIDFAAKLGSGGFLFTEGLTVAEAGGFIDLVELVAERPLALEEAREVLLARNITHVQLSPVYEDPEWFGQFTSESLDNSARNLESAPGMEAMIPIYQSLFGAVETAHGSARGNNGFDVNQARSVSEQLLSASDGNFMDIMQLVRYPDFHSYTVGHSVRVALISVLIAQKMGLDQAKTMELATAALLHDIGKSKIPDEILFKCGRLDPEERRIMESHAELGARILMENGDATPMAVAIAQGHHKRYDGKGYPDHPAWGKHDGLSSLVHVIDVFEALTAVRPYKAAMTPRQAYEIMFSDRDSFNPSAFALFVKAMGLYPPGCRLLLTDGSKGIVIAANEDISRPVIQLTHDNEGGRLSADRSRVLDLSREKPAGVGVAGLLLDDETPIADETFLTIAEETPQKSDAVIEIMESSS